MLLQKQGKIVEINEIMKELNLQILSLEEAAIDIEIIENGSTFEENTIIKVKRNYENN